MKKIMITLIIMITLSLMLTGCKRNNKEVTADVEEGISNTVENQSKEEEKIDSNKDAVSQNVDNNNISQVDTVSEVNKNQDENQIVTYAYNHELNVIDDNYRTYYEVFLYSFCDSDGDGIGDINGLISKLDYINDGDPNTDNDLGFNGIWLMPIMPSNTYHKYDVMDYYSIDKQYGTMDDFKHLLSECKKRGIKVILDLVINHSSSQNPWFKSALKSLVIEPCGQETCTYKELCREHNPYVKYYNFVEGKPKAGNYYSTGIGDWYYEGDFSSNMPDFNLADKSLRADIENILKYWLDLGVGGFRLDAALHYYPEDTVKNTEAISWLNNFIKSKNKDNYMVAEVWTNFSHYVKYYASGIDSVFDFAFATESGIIAKTLNYAGPDNSGQTFGKAMLQVQEGLKKYSDTAIDAPFFTNHDTARAAGYFPGSTDKIKMAAALNLFMSGSAFVYYGEEIGMSGSGKDENKRAPMYWSATDNKGMTNGPKNMESITHDYGSVEEQIKDPLSIYQYYKSVIRLRNENPEIARGDIKLMNEVMDTDICALTKTYKQSRIIMLYNISDKTKEVTIGKESYGYEGIRGYLTVNGEAVTLSGESINLPPYAIAILK